MNDFDLEQLVEAAFNLELEYEGLEGVLRPPATPAQIEECEKLLGRRFSPSYRHFLTLHNGWEDFPGAMLLLGTEDYTSQAVRNEVAFRFKCQLEVLEAPVESVPEHILWPENIYHLYYLSRPELADWIKLSHFIHEFDEEKWGLLWSKHMVIAVDFDAPRMMFFDQNTLDDDGEMEVVSLWNDGSEFRCKNFYTFLEHLGRDANDDD